MDVYKILFDYYKNIFDNNLACDFCESNFRIPFLEIEGIELDENLTLRVEAFGEFAMDYDSYNVDIDDICVTLAYKNEYMDEERFILEGEELPDPFMKKLLKKIDEWSYESWLELRESEDDAEGAREAAYFGWYHR